MLGYLIWAVFALAVVTAFMRAHQPHWGLFAGSIFLLAGVGLLSVGELQPWAYNRGVQGSLQFAVSIWAIASTLWVAYVALVILPIAFLTNIPTTSNGRGLLALLTFMPLPLLYAVVWRMRYSRIAKAVARRQ